MIAWWWLVPAFVLGLLAAFGLVWVGATIADASDEQLENIVEGL